MRRDCKVLLDASLKIWKNVSNVFQKISVAPNQVSNNPQALAYGAIRQTSAEEQLETLVGQFKLADEAMQNV